MALGGDFGANVGKPTAGLTKKEQWWAPNRLVGGKPGQTFPGRRVKTPDSSSGTPVADGSSR
jgi:hypothetical protein